MCLEELRGVLGSAGLGVEPAGVIVPVGLVSTHLRCASGAGGSRDSVDAVNTWVTHRA